MKTESEKFEECKKLGSELLSKQINLQPLPYGNMCVTRIRTMGSVTIKPENLKQITIDNHFGKVIYLKHKNGDILELEME